LRLAPPAKTASFTAAQAPEDVKRDQQLAARLHGFGHQNGRGTSPL